MLRHMLDFRLMTGQRVAILDGSRSLFDIGVPTSATNRKTLDEHICWQPIPGLEEIVLESVKELLSASGVASGNITNIGVGVICDTSTVTPLIRAIHTRVLRQLS
jgi:mediator of RNA polymerase II transcription subunit 14